MCHRALGGAGPWNGATRRMPCVSGDIAAHRKPPHAEPAEAHYAPGPRLSQELACARWGLTATGLGALYASWPVGTARAAPLPL